jgi:hypothetical protein
MRFLPNGTILAIHDDDLPYDKMFGSEFSKKRRRASIINTVEEGMFAGYFYADMSHLADLMHNDSHRVCLYPPRKTERECKAAEVAYIERHFIGKDLKTGFENLQEHCAGTE